jgi:probable phosphoglycerate mutase
MALETLIHIRHGETAWNAERRLQGAQDIPLNPLGEEQARRNGRVLAEELGRLGLAPARLRYVASPLGRCRRTMEAVRRELGLDPAAYEIEPRLKEVTFGRYEGYTYKEIRGLDPAGYASLRADKWNFLPPGGESYAMLRERLQPFWESLEGDCVIVAHGGVFRALLTLMTTDFDPAVAETFVPQDRFFVWRDGVGRWV